MSQPPINPTISKKGQPITYFEKITGDVVRLFRENETLEEINIDFKGFRDLMKRYRALTMNSKEEAWSLAKDFSIWTDYLIGLQSLIQRSYANMETEKIKIISIASHEADANTVANGKRIANRDESVVEVRKARNLLKAYHEALELKIEFLTKAHHNCKATYQMFKND